ncbi:MAG: L-fucose:H+ symporter permease [Prevotella sp.]|nr:L-fucose:H+ symporter permease [Prevotella sp.]MCI5855052.1 L-fucose:H+ symporter permease [Prevotella sp.]MDY6091741.1 L-fucose:H+ symporter permease [Prevotella sp.]
MNTGKNGLLVKDGVSLLVPFILITFCFALWGFANDVTTPMVKAFSKIFRMSVTEGAMVQVAFYLGYFVMAFPAALFIQRYSFKAGVLVGLSLYAIGALMFLPAKAIGIYPPFLLAYFIMTSGLSFLETSCNPYIYCMGSEETATQRLNLAQAFNPIGALTGMFVAMHFVQARMNPMDSASRMLLTELQFNAIKAHDLDILIQPYIFIGAVIIVLAIVIRLMKMPMDSDTHSTTGILSSLKELVKMKNYREGVLAQFFYVGAQVTCWTFIIQYGTRIFMEEGLDERGAEILSQKYNIIALIFFTCSRFICTWFLKYIQPGRLLSILAVIATVLTGGVILFTDRNGLICLVGISACMSLMFPTIYGIALRGLGDHVKVGGAGLIMSILGGSVFPPLQAAIIDSDATIFGLPATNISFIIPLICFIVITIYGHRAYIRHNITHEC